MTTFVDVDNIKPEDEDEFIQIGQKNTKRFKIFESDEEDEEPKHLIGNFHDEENAGIKPDTSRKRKKSASLLDLDDEDYDLIEENLGFRVTRKKRYRRVRKTSDDKGQVSKIKDREAIAAELFPAEESDEGDNNCQQECHDKEYREDEESTESDADDFVVDDVGRPTIQKPKEHVHTVNAAALQDAQDIFGVDFNFKDLEKCEEDEEASIGEISEGRRKKSKTFGKKITCRSIFDMYEPSELKQRYYTDLDEKIRNEDIPERMQLRCIPVTRVPEGSNELEEEAKWIYKQAFTKLTISIQDTEGNVDLKNATEIENLTSKIKNALHFMRNDSKEVPFIAFYRKEEVMPELKVNNLWKVYKYDGKWCLLKTRKAALLKLFENMRQFQLKEYIHNLNTKLPEYVRLLTDEDIARLESVETAEEFNDVHMHFLLYYSHLIPKMHKMKCAKERELSQARRRYKEKRSDVEGNVKTFVGIGEETSELEKEEESVLQHEENEVVKPATRSGLYAVCRKAKLDGFAKRFGLKPEQFAENFNENRQKHKVEQDPLSPHEIAEEYTNGSLTTPDVLKAVKFMVATQLSHEPLVRKVLREAFFERAKFDVVPTPYGVKEIDESHISYSMKYLKAKPVRSLSGVEFLKLHIAEEDGLLKVIFDEHIKGVKSISCLEEMKNLYSYNPDEFSSVVQEWNQFRQECIELAYRELLCPAIIKELRIQLINEARECVLKECSKKLYNWLKIAPYSVEFQEVKEEWDCSEGLRIMGVAYSQDFEQAPYAAIVEPSGKCTYYKRLPSLLKRTNAYRATERAAKEKDLRVLSNFISKKKPHVICVSAESRQALMVVKEIKDIVKQLIEDEQFPLIPVEILDNDLAKVYSKSLKGMSDFCDYPEILRQAISLARRLQDPLVEFSQLCTSDDEILCLRYHPLQAHVSREDLLEVVTCEFVNRTNEVGIDINKVVHNAYLGNLLQYICGLGSRKAIALIKVLKQTNQKLENRHQLNTMCHMKPSIFNNCAGFIRIDTDAIGDSSDNSVEVLDGSRVHPEAYEWAHKLAIKALEYDDEANSMQAVEEIIKCPDRLKDPFLDAFAKELNSRGFGNKSLTVYDIRDEFHHRFKDFRVPFIHPTEEELFDLLTNETPETLYVGKLMQAVVVGVAKSKPRIEQLDQANPYRDPNTNLYECPFCSKNDFLDLTGVWTHFDAGCPGRPVGVHIRLDNDIFGFIHTKNLSDKYVNHPEEVVHVDQVIHCRVLSLDAQRLSVEATAKASDVNDIANKFRPARDAFYNYEAEEQDKKEEERAWMLKVARTYLKRVIRHPSFKNCSYKEALKLMMNMEQGECLVRPSIKGVDHLTVTWKVTDNIYQHVDILERKKKTPFSLGQALWIGKYKFDDLSEVIARYIYPMARNVREILNYKYYKDTDGGKLEKAEAFICKEYTQNVGKMHYLLSAMANRPGKFLLTYLSRNYFKHEFITVTPVGYRFREKMFITLNDCLTWFKRHFKEPIPGVPLQELHSQTGVIDNECSSW